MNIGLEIYYALQILGAFILSIGGTILILGNDFISYGIGFIVSLILIWLITVDHNEHEGESDNEPFSKKVKLMDDLVDSTSVKRLNEIAFKYQKQLAKLKTKSITYDKYDEIEDLSWKKEIQDFLKLKFNYIPDSFQGDLKHISISSCPYATVIDDIASDNFNESELSGDIDIMTGEEYEHYCCELLNSHGFESIVTKASGDQGVDIISKVNGLIVAIQCKRLSKPVGNKAIQEVSAGKQYRNADIAVVITNNSYTKSAITLAESLDVKLKHHSDLKYIEDWLT